MSFDTETFGLGRFDAAFGLSVAFDTQAHYWDLRENPGALRWLEDAARVAPVLVAANAPFDFRSVSNCGLTLPVEKLDDVITRAVLIDEHLLSYSLDDLARKYLKSSKTTDIYESLAGLFGGKATRSAQMKNISRAPSGIVAPYAMQDARLTLDLWNWQQKEISRQGIQQIVDFERSVTPTIIEMSMAGIRVDVGLADEARKKVSIEADRLQSELNSLVGFDINVNSTPQVRDLFKPVQTSAGWVSDSGHPLGKTDSGAPSVNAEVLRSMESDKRARLILEIRSLIKTADTFLGGHVIASAVDGRVYPTINQTRGESAGTVTGRLSYNGPAMQQIPSRNKKVAAIVKPVFLPEEGHLWLDSDCASQEVRVFAHLINNPTVNQKFKDDIKTDFHQLVADLTGLPRNASYSGQANSKQLNLCVGAGTQYLSPTGWVNIENYDGGDVAQWSTDGSIQFVRPVHYHTGQSDDVYTMSSKWGTLVATGNHRMPTWSPQKSGYRVVDRTIGEMSKVPKRNFSLVIEWERHGAGVGWTDDELRKLRIGIKARRSAMSYNIRPAEPQNVYCFTVPSGYFLVRTREGQVLVSGNSMIFNSGNGAIADKMGMPWEWAEFVTDDGETVRYRKAGVEAMRVIDNYHSSIPGVKNLAQAAAKTAGERGYIRTHYGRRIRFPNKRFLYKASGLLIQATAADINKAMVVGVNDVAKKHGGRLVLNTHDSFSVSVPKDWRGLWNDMQRLPDDLFGSWIRIPLFLELSGVGKNWWASLVDEEGAT